MKIKNQYKKYSKVCLTFLFFIGLNFVSFGQTKPIIKNCYSFFTEQLPGNIMVDNNGKPYPIKIDTTVIIYLETITKEINWKTVYKNGIAYNIAFHIIVPTPFIAGKLNNNHKTVTLDVEKDNFLWQLYIQPQPQQKEKIAFTRQKGIWINGKYKGKLIFKKIGDPVQLAAIPSV